MTIYEEGDSAERISISTDLDATLFVEAGAGTGKTSQLVSRILALVLTGRSHIEQLAAITFTEAAAAELRDRVLEKFEQLAQQEIGTVLQGYLGEVVGPLDSIKIERVHEALSGIDSAAITTLHGFARRILSENPFEAGLPPSFEVLDEISSGANFEERWEEYLESLLTDPSRKALLSRALAIGISIDSLRDVGRLLTKNWDLVPEVSNERNSQPASLVPVETEPLESALQEAIDLLQYCSDTSDLLFIHLLSVVNFKDDLEKSSNELESLMLLFAQSKLENGKKGRKENWSGKKNDVLEKLGLAQEIFVGIKDKISHDLVDRLLVDLSFWVHRCSEQRRIEGRLEFHDLLVHSRNLVRRHGEAWRLLHDQYHYILVDEFQDTDPIQAELAVRICTDDLDAGEKDWMELTLPPGRLFFVGDPKQSIYRFRRADIALFLKMRDRVGGGVIQLRNNFRSVPGILNWINSIFSELIGEGDGESQPRYEPLAASVKSNSVSRAKRGNREGDMPSQPTSPVVILGKEGMVDVRIDAVRREEAQDIAKAVTSIRDNKWVKRVGTDFNDKPSFEPIALSDIAILIPNRISLLTIEDALEDAGIAYRLESSSLVYTASEICDLFTILCAIDNPGDEVAIIGALRTPGLGCGDDDLVDYFRLGGSWDYRSELPPAISRDHKVALGLRALLELHEVRCWNEVSSLIELVLDRFRFFELALGGPHAREAWRRFRFVLDQARQFCDDQTGDLRRYLRWVALQSDDSVRATEVILPEADLDAVRIMTVHASKGLEFPVVILTGLGSGQNYSNLPKVLFTPDGLEASFGVDLRSNRYQELAEREKNFLRNERIRLLYVAATRAQDYLVACLHRSEKDNGSHAGLLASICSEHPELWSELDVFNGSELSVGVSACSGLSTSQLPRDQAEITEHFENDFLDDIDSRMAWIEQRRQNLASGSIPFTLAATAIGKIARDRKSETPSHLFLNADEEKLELEATAIEESIDSRSVWRRGRAGTAIGRAVHATLQVVDLATGVNLDQLALRCASAEGVGERANEVEVLVKAAINSVEIRNAVKGGKYWRELYVGVPVGSRVLEGFIDLLVDGPNGLEVIDYKTDYIGSALDLDDLLGRYRLQGASYAVAVEEILGRSVEFCTFLFLNRQGVRSVRLFDLALAKAEVRELLASI